MRKRKASSKATSTSTGADRRRAVSAGAAEFDFEAIRELARIAGEFELAEIEVDPSGRIRVSRGTASTAVSAPAAPAPAPRPERPFGSSPVSLVPPPSEPASGDPGVAITSPFVGTFYRAPSPDAPSFVEVGQTVRKGQVVCIVEAMKLMNEIESEADGKVLEILCKNGDHVEYGQPLFRLAKS